MYRGFFGLRDSPFNVNPDPHFLYMTRHAQEALSCLLYGVQSRKGFILLTGEVGTGKTTLLNKFLDWLHRQRVSTAFVFNSRLDDMQFLDFMMADFGIACESPQKSKMLIRLNQWLLERFRSGEAAVLIVDEAQNLSNDVLEEIRLLTNLETAKEKLLQIVLCGQPELETKLQRPELRQLRQRITLRARTHPLTFEETTGYIAERLRIAGANGEPIFSTEAIQAIHQYSQGIPRVINLLAEHGLISAFVDQQKPVPAKAITDVAREFELHQLDFTATPSNGSGENVRVVEALKNLTVLVERLRRGEKVSEETVRHAYEPHT